MPFDKDSFQDGREQGWRDKEAVITALVEALEGLLMEWEKFTRYGSPIAKAANERITAARAALRLARGET